MSFELKQYPKAATCSNPWYQILRFSFVFAKIKSPKCYAWYHRMRFVSVCLKIKSPKCYAWYRIMKTLLRYNAPSATPGIE